MELTWPMKLRIAASATVGVVLIGILAWPLAEPDGPFGAVRVAAESVSGGDAIALAVLAFGAGLIGYFVSWPHGREIGILAVPAGLTIWAVRSGSMADLIRENPALEQRQALFSALKWEPLFWLAMVAAGFAGVLLAQRIGSRPAHEEEAEKPNSKQNNYLNAALAVVASGLIALVCTGILARDVAVAARSAGSVVIAQPKVAQITFAVCVSFGAAAFVVKQELNAGYIWPTAASAFVTFFAVSAYGRAQTLKYLVEQWPPVFFTNTALAILPVQMVAFGTLGSIAGYWLAVRHRFWHKHG